MLKKIFTIIATWWIATVAVVAFDVPQLTGRVTDTVGFFSKSANAKITKRIRSFEENTGAQLVVATLPELVDVSIEEAGIQLMDKWKIGAKSKDDGVIILIVPSQRRFRIEVGYGLEGVLTDGRCGDILRTMSRAFKRKHYPSGVIHAIDEIEELLDADAESQPQEGASIWVRLLAVPFVILVFFLFVVSGGGGGGGYYGGGGGGGGFTGGGGRGGGGGASGGW